MIIETGSDHRLVTADVLLDHLDFRDSLVQIKRKGVKRTIFLYDKATEENWNDYKNKLQHLLKKRLDKKLWLKKLLENNNEESINNIDLNKE